MPRRAAKKRVDLMLVGQGLAESLEQARALILEGLVATSAGLVLKPGAVLPDTAALEVRQGLPYVSRGGLKLAHALDCFAVPVSGLVGLDVGASTGGFTDCMLQRGARRIYAVDVGYGQLHYRMRQDPRVVVMEKRNARYPMSLPEAVDVITIDVSFISLTLVIPPVVQHLKDGCFVVTLVKPQFEAGRGEVGRGGVVKNPHTHARVLGRLILWAVAQGLRVRNLCPSPILGDRGNREFFLLLQKPKIRSAASYQPSATPPLPSGEAERLS